MTEAYASAIDLLERVLTEVRASASVLELRRNHFVQSSLKALGSATHVHFLRVLIASRPRQLFHYDVSALREISHDRRFCRRLQGSFLDEDLLYLLSHESIRGKVSHRFLREMNHRPAAEEGKIWTAAEPLAAAIESGVVQVARIASLAHYLGLIEVARQRINSDAYRLPPAPFPLPDGWNWFSSGADFQSLADYSPTELLHRTEFYHYGITRGDSFLLRDAAGCGWELRRIPKSDKSVLGK